MFDRTLISKSSFLKRFFVSIFLVFYIAILIFWWVSLPTKSVIIDIKPGLTARHIGDILYKNNIISCPRVFSFIVHLTGSSKDLMAGIYSFYPRLGIFSIISNLIKGNSEYIKVTIPEGFNANQIGERLESLGIVKKDVFLSIVNSKGLEGYLFPETYYFKNYQNPEEIVSIMVKEFNKRFTPDMKARAQELKMTEHDIITLASIIEKEAFLSRERPLISGVFHNRLKKGWYLESCATVLYALGKHKEVLNKKDLLVDSPYNTYRHLGLPPGPICNPGLDSIKAALYPEVTDQMFFVVSSSGSHVFSRYYQEHVKNKQNIKRKNKK